MMEYLKIHNWEKWQSYRSDRGQPPWIKVHRQIMRHIEWVSLSDAERGQLVAMWLLAADHDGVIPASPEVIQKLCYMTELPNLNKFKSLGFIDANMTSKGSQYDANMTTQTRDRLETETDKRQTRDSVERSPSLSAGDVFIHIPIQGKNNPEHPITNEQVREWKTLFPGVNVSQELKNCRAWNLANKDRRKTSRGVLRHVTAWLTRANDHPGPRGSPPHIPDTGSIAKEISSKRGCAKCGKQTEMIDEETGLCRDCFGVVEMPKEFRKAIETAFETMPELNEDERKALLREQAEGLLTK